MHGILPGSPQGLWHRHHRGVMRTALVLLLISLSATPAPAVADTMDIPAQRQSWSYPSRNLPQRSSIPERAKPVGVGPAADGGTLVSIGVSLPPFSGPVDIYSAYAHPSSPDHIFNLQDTLEFTPFDVDVVNRALTTGVIPPGAVPWLAGVAGPVEENPLTFSVSLAPPGLYTLYLLVAPAGSLQVFYLWETQFTIPAPVPSDHSVTLTWDPPTTNADGTPLTDLAGFRVHHGTAPRSYSRSLDVGNVRTFTLSDLYPGMHYFSVTAYDLSRNESTFSNEVSKRIP